MISILFVIVKFYRNQFKCNYLRYILLFLKFFAPFLKSTSILEHFSKRITLKDDVFPKIRSAKEMVRWMSTTPSFRTSFDSQHVKGSQTLIETAQQHFYNAFAWEKLSRKVSLIVTCEIVDVLITNWLSMTSIFYL